jgi:hypothetical protein
LAKSPIMFSPKSSSTRFENGRARAFSLVLSLTVMAMLLLLCIGAAALLTVELRVSRATASYAKARLNAMAGARIALGEVQRLLGPDQRTTATATILCDPLTTQKDPTQDDFYAGNPLSGVGKVTHPRWVGVWNSGFADNDHGSRGQFVQRDATQGVLEDLRFKSGGTSVVTWAKDRVTSRRLLGWLVSGNEATPATQGTARAAGYHFPDDAVTLPSEQTTLLAGTSSTSDKLGASAPLVTIPSGSLGGNPLGRYAYWVSDEGVKAKLNIADRNNNGTNLLMPDLSNPKEGGYARLLRSQKNNFDLVRAATDAVAGGKAYFSKLSTLPQGQVAAIGSFSDYAMLDSDVTPAELNDKFYHDISFVSRGVLADPVNGGLKKDLTAYLLGKTVTTSGDYIGVDDSTPLITDVSTAGVLNPVSFFSKHTPTLKFIKDWAVTNAPLLAATSAPALPPGMTASAVTNMHYLTPDYSQFTNPPTAAKVARAPVLTQFKIYHQLAKFNNEIVVAVAPVVTLWNPYSVPLILNNYHVSTEGGLIFSYNITYDKVPINPGQNNNARLFEFLSWRGNNGRLDFIVPIGTKLAPGESITLSAPAGNPTPVDYSKYEAWVPDPAATLAPISPSTSFFTYSASKNGFAYKLSAQEVTDIFASSTPPRWNNSNGMGSLGNEYYGLFGAPPPIRVLLRDSTGVVQFLDTSPYSDLWVRGSGFSSYIPLRDLAATPLATSMTTNEVAGTYGLKLLNVDQLPETPVGAICDNTNFNTFVQFNFRALKSTRFPTDAASTSRTNALKSFGLFHQEWAPTSFNQIAGQSLNSPLFNNPSLSPTNKFCVSDVAWREWGLTSLAALQHCPLTTMPWLTAFAVGNSYASPSVDLGKSARGMGDQTTDWAAAIRLDANGKTAANSSAPLSSLQPYVIESGLLTGSLLTYDASYEYNRSLYDTWMVSGVTDAAATGWASGDTWALTSINSLDSRLMPNGKHACPSPLYAAAAGLMLDGAFNINSTSKAAWVALFSSAREITTPTRGGSVSTKESTPFPHVILPPTNEVATKSATPYDQSVWGGVRTLSDDEIAQLAEAMVFVVKERGPFLGLADFVNRRLRTNDDSGNPVPYTAYREFTGALQAAIDKASADNGAINRPLDTCSSYPDMLLNRKDSDGTTMTGAAPRPNAINLSATKSVPQQVGNRVSSKIVGAPGYLTQADVLQHIGSALASRSDTFIIRAEGVDADSGVTAHVELTVQRLPEALYSKAGDPYNFNKKSSEGVQFFGRRFTTVAVRWLHFDEI